MSHIFKSYFVLVFEKQKKKSALQQQRNSQIGLTKRGVKISTPKQSFLKSNALPSRPRKYLLEPKKFKRESNEKEHCCYSNLKKALPSQTVIGSHLAYLFLNNSLIRFNCPFTPEELMAWQKGEY